jgi:hypothetical protein
MVTEEEMTAGVAEMWCEQTVAIVRVREVQKRKWKLQTIIPHKDKKRKNKKQRWPQQNSIFASSYGLTGKERRVYVE